MIVGVDVSSKRIDLAWLDNGKPQRWHQELAKGHLIDRLRSIDIIWPAPNANSAWPQTDVTDVAIEYPYAVQKPAVAALMATVGIVTKKAPPWARVAWPSSGELRQAIGARNNKTAAHQAAWLMYHEPNITTTLDLPTTTHHHGIPYPSTLSTTGPHPLHGWDEHELDALIACIGWTRILNQQDAA